MRLTWLPANNAFAFTLGDSLVRMDGAPMFYQSKKEARDEAARHGLTVNSLGCVRPSESECAK